MINRFREDLRCGRSTAEAIYRKYEARGNIDEAFGLYLALYDSKSSERHYELFCHVLLHFYNDTNNWAYRHQIKH